MKNFVQPAKTVTIASPADVLSGGVVVAGNLVGIAAGDALSGALLDVTLEGCFSVPKVAADVVAVGSPIYYDDATELATVTVGTNDRLGTAIAAAGNGVGSVKVRLVQL